MNRFNKLWDQLINFMPFSIDVESTHKISPINYDGIEKTPCNPTKDSIQIPDTPGESIFFMISEGLKQLVNLDEIKPGYCPAITAHFNNDPSNVYLYYHDLNNCCNSITLPTGQIFKFSNSLDVDLSTCDNLISEKFVMQSIESHLQPLSQKYDIDAKHDVIYVRPKNTNNTK